MRGVGLRRKRMDGLRDRLPLNQVPPKVIVGSIAIAAVVLSLVFSRGGQPPEPVAKFGATPVPAAALATLPALAPKPAVGAPAATATAIPVATAPAKEQIHTVASGDTLSTLAGKYYNDASKWNKIYEANKDILSSPNALQVGQKLRIPD